MSSAMILAAGRGERMRPLTDTCPKPLLVVGGKPLIVWQIERLVSAGFHDLVINHAHLGSMIEAALGTGSAWGARIRYSPEPVALETAGGIANALPLLGRDPFIVANGDVYAGYDFTNLVRVIERFRVGGQPDRAHLVLVDNPAHHPGGDFVLEQGRVTASGPDRLTYAGIGVFTSALFAPVARGNPARLAPLLHAAIATGAVSGERFDGTWIDVGTPERLGHLDRQLRTQGHGSG
jgi:MurNAc alpha-1-phosphate uridylyltransferase